MACDCTTYQCLDIDLDPCSNGVELPLQATETADWVVLIEFNGVWIRLSIAVEDGENIVIPNVLNEYYVHTIKLLDSSKGLFNDTCYKLISHTVSGLDVNLPTPESSMEIQPALLFTTGPAIAEYQDDLLIGAVIISVELEGLVYTDYTFDSETGTITTPLLLPDGGTMQVLYKK